MLDTPVNVQDFAKEKLSAKTQLEMFLQLLIYLGVSLMVYICMNQLIAANREVLAVCCLYSYIFILLLFKLLFTFLEFYQ